MKTRTIGDVTVSAIGLGGMPMSIEGRPDEDRSIAHHPRRARRRRDAHRHRGRLPPARGRGRPQRVASSPKALAAYGGDTSDVLVATKGGHLRPGDGTLDVDGSPGVPASEAVRGVAQAARRRGIGLYQFHRPDPKVPYEESVGAIRDLLDEGKIRMAGISNANPEQIEAGAGDPRRTPGLGAEPVLAGVPLQRAGAGAVPTSWASRSCRGARSAASPRAGEARQPLRAVPEDSG